MIHVTYRLTAKNRYQLRDPTFGNRVWATYLFYASDRDAHLLSSAVSS